MSKQLIDMTEQPTTIETLERDFKNLGVTQGITLLVHSSLKSLGTWISGGPVAVIQALERCLGEEGTLVMPTHSANWSDPATWDSPPVPKSWWETIRRTMPAYEPDVTPCYYMGVIPDCFRSQRGVLRSAHPQGSFAAKGKYASYITEDHTLDDMFGDTSPLAKLYELNAWVLLLGVNHESNTSIHLAECRAEYRTKKYLESGAPVMLNGNREWVAFRDINYDSEDFQQSGEDYEKNIGSENTYLLKKGMVARAPGVLISQPSLVDFSMKWLELNRNK